MPKKSNLNFALIPLDNWTQFSSKQLSGICPSRPQSKNMSLLNKIEKTYVLFSAFLRKFDSPEGRKLCLCMMLLLTRTDFFFESSRLPSSLKISTGKFWILISFDGETIVSIALSGDSIGGEFQNWHMHVVLFEIPTHLSPRLLTGLLPSRPQWTVSSVWNVTQ